MRLYVTTDEVGFDTFILTALPRGRTVPGEAVSAMRGERSQFGNTPTTASGVKEWHAPSQKAYVVASIEQTHHCVRCRPDQEEASARAQMS